MALYMKQEQEKTELQKRIAAELADKAKNKSPDPATKNPDGVEDSAYMENTKRTTSLAWVWILIGVSVVAIAIWLVVIAS